MSTPNSNLTQLTELLQSLNPDELSLLLSSSDELIKKTQKAAQEAKQIALDRISKETAQAAIVANTNVENEITKPVIDIKRFLKLEKLVQNPYNDDAIKQFKALIDGYSLPLGTSLNNSLFCISIKYLLSKTRIDLEWPIFILNHMDTITASDLVESINLIYDRSFDKKDAFFSSLFSKSVSWFDLHNQIISDKANDNKYARKAFLDSNKSTLVDFWIEKGSHHPQFWTYLQKFFHSGFANYYKNLPLSTPFWHQLAALSNDRYSYNSSSNNNNESTENQKIAFFQYLFNHDFMTQPTQGYVKTVNSYSTATSLNLFNPEYPEKKLLQHPQQNASFYYLFMLLHREIQPNSSSAAIFKHFLDYERKHQSFTHTDYQGNSHLFYLNLLSNSNNSNNEKAPESIQAMMQSVIDTGTPVESVAPATFLSLVHNAQLRSFLHHAHTEQKLNSLVEIDSTPKKSSFSL